MPDYRALAQALGTSQPTPQEIERMAALQGPAFGVFPQMKPYRSEQDITASANVPVDLLRGRVAGTRGLFGDVVNQPIPMVRPLQLLSQAFTGQQKYPDTEHYLDTMPLKSDTPIGDVAGRIGSFAPINPMPAVRAGQKGLNMLGMEVADRLATGRSVLPSLLKEPQTAMFAVNPADQMAQAVTKAEVSPLGFYSAVEQQALKIPRKQGTGDSFLNDLMKGQDVKKYEIEAMGLENYLRGKPNVTRQEVQDFIANNRLNVQQTQLGGKIEEDPLGIAKREEIFNKYEPEIQDLYRRLDKPEYVMYDKATNEVLRNYDTYEDALVDNLKPNTPSGTYIRPKENSRELQQQLESLQNKRDVEANAAYLVPQTKPTKYQRYQLPGGENYRELLLTLPNKPMDASRAAENYYTQFVKRGGEPDWSQLTPDKQQDVINSMPTQARNASASPEYRSSHFNEPNILAHMRVNDRVDAEGKKMLLIEEVQSDWHQAGREKGYQSVDSGKAMQAFNQYSNELAAKYDLNPAQNLSMYATIKNIKPEEIAKYDALQSEYVKATSGVPDAPFKDTWHQLALKRAIKEAVDKGYDRIGLTTGAQQAERYDLAKQINELSYKKMEDDLTLSLGDGPYYEVSAIDKNNSPVLKKQVTEKELPNLVGKEMAKKIINGEGSGYPDGSISSGSKVFTGIDLQVGGEGMRKYYDEVYPNYLNKLGKKYGAQVGETKVNTGIDNLPAGSSVPTMKQEPVRYLDITPEMRKAIKEGQPLASIEEELAKALA